jgi:hypothetical protein
MPMTYIKLEISILRVSVVSGAIFIYLTSSISLWDSLMTVSITTEDALGA